MNIAIRGDSPEKRSYFATLAAKSKLLLAINTKDPNGFDKIWLANRSKRVKTLLYGPTVNRPEVQRLLIELIINDIIEPQIKRQANKI